MTSGRVFTRPLYRIGRYAGGNNINHCRRFNRLNRHGFYHKRSEIKIVIFRSSREANNGGTVTCGILMIAFLLCIILGYGNDTKIEIVIQTQRLSVKKNLCLEETLTVFEKVSDLPVCSEINRELKALRVNSFEQPAASARNFKKSEISI